VRLGGAWATALLQAGPVSQWVTPRLSTASAEGGREAAPAAQGRNPPARVAPSLKAFHQGLEAQGFFQAPAASTVGGRAAQQPRPPAAGSRNGRQQRPRRFGAARRRQQRGEGLGNTDQNLRLDFETLGRFRFAQSGKGLINPMLVFAEVCVCCGCQLAATGQGNPGKSIVSRRSDGERPLAFAFSG